MYPRKEISITWGFKVLTAVKSIVFCWVVTPCCLVRCYQRLGGECGQDKSATITHRHNPEHHDQDMFTIVFYVRSSQPNELFTDDLGSEKPHNIFATL
jgi:hypothetical protein